MSENAQRIGILIITLIFLVTTIGIALYAIIFNESSNNQEVSQEELNQLIEQQSQEDFVAITCTTDESLKYTPTPPLQDKPLPNFSTVQDIPELKCIDIVIGQGEEVKPGATVTAHYTGAIATTGNVFQSSHDGGQPIAFPLSGVIKGWTNGVPGMKVGGIRRIYIPSDQAYGEQGNSGIPPNSDLVFDVEITKIGE
jgi:FKBP-type peptidyl-prolyl cis-trans isomerase